MRLGVGVRLDELERKYQNYDDAVAAVRDLMNPSATKRRGADFTADIRDQK